MLLTLTSRFSSILFFALTFKTAAMRYLIDKVPEIQRVSQIGIRSRIFIISKMHSTRSKIKTLKSNKIFESHLQDQRILSNENYRNQG